LLDRALREPVDQEIEQQLEALIVVGIGEVLGHRDEVGELVGGKGGM
jgi:hypothetical protein